MATRTYLNISGVYKITNVINNMKKGMLRAKLERESNHE